MLLKILFIGIELFSFPYVDRQFIVNFCCHETKRFACIFSFNFWKLDKTLIVFLDEDVIGLV